MQGLARLEELVRKVMDIVDNRVQANLDTIRAMLLVDLPADRCAYTSLSASVPALPQPLLATNPGESWLLSTAQMLSPLCD
jgi:hypothetical protein